MLVIMVTLQKNVTVLGMAEMLEFMHTQRGEDLLKANDNINFMYKSSHI